MPQIVKFLVKIDDSLDVFAEHGVGGMIGLMFNGIFGANYIIGLDGVNADPDTYPGGWIQRYWPQFYKQLAYVVACTAYSFVVSAILAYAINYIPGLKLRASEEAELLGMDDDQLGEFAYDYVEVRRDYLAWTPATAEPAPHSDIPNQDRHGIPQHSQMLDNGKENKDLSELSDSSHTGVGGDRHAVAAN